MSTIIKKKRLLVKNYSPKTIKWIPNNIKFGNSEKWSNEQLLWLEGNYPDTEDYDLAMALNCGISHIIEVAKKNRWEKSDKFKMWMEHPEQDPSCPRGFHWETESERQLREAEENERYRKRAINLANTFSFCTTSEKEQLSCILYQAIKWGRETTQTINLDDNGF